MTRTAANGPSVGTSEASALEQVTRERDEAYDAIEAVADDLRERSRTLFGKDSTACSALMNAALGLEAFLASSMEKTGDT